MPDANGQMFLSDFRAELQSRGFDGFSASDLNAMINRGYFHIARKFPWYWRQKSAQIPYPAAGYTSVADTNANFPGFKNVRAVYLEGYPTSTSKIRLDPVNEQDAFNGYLADLDRGVTGTPSIYFIDEDKLYALPKLSSVGSAVLEVHYNNRPQALTADSSIAVTPVDLDEAILLAALIRCHKRALEVNLAIDAQVQLEEILDDLKDLEGDRMDDLQERVRPDNTWA
jgi:hypothetical protein